MNSDSPPDPLEAARNEVYRKLGGSMVLLQQLEHGLKKFVELQMIEGSTMEEAEDFVSRRRAGVSKMPLGGVVTRFFEDPTKVKEPEVTGTWFRACFKVVDDAHVQARSDSLQALVAERNDLVHGLIGGYDLGAADDIARLDARLASLTERVRAALLELQNDLEHLGRIRQRTAELFGDPEFVEHMLSQFRANDGSAP